MDAKHSEGGNNDFQGANNKLVTKQQQSANKLEPDWFRHRNQTPALSKALHYYCISWVLVLPESKLRPSTGAI